MEPITIFLILLGVALLIGSCFLPKEKKGEIEYDALISRLAKRELSKEETEHIRHTVDQIISEKTEEVIVKTDDYLSQVANEKIMSVDEFSKQILERLDKNNSDVMFLYKMVTETKDELKSEIADAKKLKEALERSLEQKNKEENSMSGNSNADFAQGKASIQKPEPVRKPLLRNDAEESKKDEAAATMTPEPAETMDGVKQKQTILKLYKSGKSIREISRELSMGQGEVKLVIDLYGL